MRVVRATIVVLVFLVACGAALPFAPTSWESSLPATSSAFNKDGIFFVDWGNKTVGKMSPVNGELMWTSASLRGFIDLINQAMVATDEVVMLSSKIIDGSPMLWTFNATTGETIANLSVTFNCNTLLMPVCSSYFVCIGDTNPTVSTLLDMHGSTVWSSAAEGVYMMSYNAIYCMKTQTQDSSSEVVYFATYSQTDNLFALMLVNVADGTVTTVPNVTTISATYDGVAYAVLSDNSVGALVLSSTDSHRYLSWLWRTSAAANTIVSFDNTAYLYVVGTSLLLYGPQAFNGLLVGLGLADGSLLGTLTLKYIVSAVQPATGALPHGLSSVAIVGPYFVIAYSNNTVSERDVLAVIDPVLMNIVASSRVIPGNTFNVINGNATCPTSLFVPNGMGFSRVQITPQALVPVSYNLQLPNIDSVLAFSDTPDAGQTTVVVWQETNITGSVFSC